VRHPGPNLRASEWRVAVIDRETTLPLVRALHYARGGSNAGSAFHGLYRLGDPLRCYGAAWWLRPIVAAARYVARPGEDWRAVLALSRLVVDPEVPRNGASFLLGRAVRLLPSTWTSLVTYADERMGHTGAIYRACGWEYDGTTAPARAWLDPATGRMVSVEAAGWTGAAEMRRRGYVQTKRAVKHRFILRRA